MNGFVIWIVSRDKKLSDTWYRILSRELFSVERLDSLEALTAASNGKSGLALVEMSGSQLREPSGIRTFLEDRRNVYLIAAGPKSAEDPKVLAGVLEAGADDYINTCIEDCLFLAKIKTHLRRLCPSPGYSRSIVRSKGGELEVDRLHHTIRICAEDMKAGISRSFTPKEFDILAILISKEEEVVSRSFFMEEIWKEKTGDVNCASVDKHVSALRLKLGSYGRNIRSVYGSGYVYSAR